MFKEFHFKGFSLLPLLLLGLCLHLLFIWFLMVLLFIRVTQLPVKYMGHYNLDQKTTVWTGCIPCRGTEWTWASEWGSWVIIAQTSTGNNVFLINVYILVKKLFVRDETNGLMVLICCFCEIGRIWQLGLLSGCKSWVVTKSVRSRPFKHPDTWLMHHRLSDLIHTQKE